MGGGGPRPQSQKEPATRTFGLPICAAAAPAHRLRPGTTLAVRYTEWLAVIGAVGSFGDSYDNAAAESLTRLVETEVIRHCGPRRGLDQAKISILEWVDWFQQLPAAQLLRQRSTRQVRATALPFDRLPRDPRGGTTEPPLNPARFKADAPVLAVLRTSSGTAPPADKRPGELTGRLLSYADLSPKDEVTLSSREPDRQIDVRLCVANGRRQWLINGNSCDEHGRWASRPARGCGWSRAVSR